MDAPQELVGRVLREILIDHFDTFELADILGNVLSFDEQEHYEVDDEDKWLELCEPVADDVQFALRELWKTVYRDYEPRKAARSVT